MSTHTTEPAAGHRCEESRGLRIDVGGATRCWRHMTAAEHKLAIDLDLSAPAYGVTGGRWPYGANVYLDMRQRMIAWADDRGLKLAHPACMCPFWLLAGLCRQYCQTWIDHPSAWHAGRNRGRVLIAQPYEVDSAVSYLASMAAEGFEVRVSPPLARDSADPDASAALAAAGVTILPPGQSWYWPQRTWLIEARGTQAARDRYAELNSRRHRSYHPVGRKDRQAVPAPLGSQAPVG